MRDERIEVRVEGAAPGAKAKVGMSVWVGPADLRTRDHVAPGRRGERGGVSRRRGPGRQQVAAAEDTVAFVVTTCFGDVAPGDRPAALELDQPGFTVVLRRRIVA